MISMQYQATCDENKEISTGGLLVDPIPNSPNYHHKNCIEDGKEND